jgi:uncharacterized membrane protein
MEKSKSKSKSKQWASLAVAAILTTGVSFAVSSAAGDDAKSQEKMEKCYGIVKKGKNECAGNNHTCQGQNTKDSDPGDWIYVPTGTCEKIVGGIKK